MILNELTGFMSITQRDPTINMSVADNGLIEIDRRGLAGTKKFKLLVRSQGRRGIVVLSEHSIDLEVLLLEQGCQLGCPLILFPPEQRPAVRAV